MRNLIRFFKNIYTFRKDLWSHGGYDAMDSLGMLNTSLKQVHKGMISKGNQGFHYAKRARALKKTIGLIDRVSSYDYLEDVQSKISVKNDGETSFGKDVSSKLNNLSEILSESMDNQNKDWQRIFALLKSSEFGIRSWWW